MRQAFGDRPSRRIGAARPGLLGNVTDKLAEPSVGLLPELLPFICQTDQFVLPDGSKLGPPLDGNCSARTVVQHVYRTTEAKPAFKALPKNVTAATLPSDLAKTTTTAGTTVNFIVRVARAGTGLPSVPMAW